MKDTVDDVCWCILDVEANVQVRIISYLHIWNLYVYISPMKIIRTQFGDTIADAGWSDFDPVSNSAITGLIACYVNVKCMQEHMATHAHTSQFFIMMSTGHYVIFIKHPHTQCVQLCSSFFLFLAVFSCGKAQWHQVLVFPCANESVTFLCWAQIQPIVDEKWDFHLPITSDCWDDKRSR